MPIIQVAPDENRQLQNVANILASAKRIVMVTGAGISTNCGIPDFRSEDGLYALIQSQYDRASVENPHKDDGSRSQALNRSSMSTRRLEGSLPTNVKGKDLFDARIWNDPISTSVFYTFIASLRRRIREEVKQTTLTHRFIRTIRDSRKLVRCYTQNIDGLESRLGLCMDLSRGKGNRSRFATKTLKTPAAFAKPIPGDNLDGGCEVVPLHGDLDVLRCSLCQQLCVWEERGGEAKILRGQAPSCFACRAADQQRRDRGKRGTKIGSLRPNIVLYGEEHPAADAVGSITAHDLSLAPDVLLILGTSLHVRGVKTLVREFAKCVHARPNGRGKVIFVNLSKPSESIWKDSIDYWVSMDCDAWIGSLRRHRPDIWEIQTELKARVIKKKDAQCSPKPMMPLTLGKVLLEGKENSGPVSSSNPPRPHQKSPGRPRKQPLMDLGINVESKIRKQIQVAIECTEPGESEDSHQLPTPPPSTHKHTSQTREGKRNRDDEEREQPTTPSKKPRFLERAAHLLVPFTRSLPSARRSSPSKRQRLAIPIWED
ncbi:MAG: hypothetical protein Q9219_000727 [cf. Caloplaca sp. 3 TL-2023]